MGSQQNQEDPAPNGGEGAAEEIYISQDTMIIEKEPGIGPAWDP